MQEHLKSDGTDFHNHEDDDFKGFSGNQIMEVLSTIVLGLR